MTFGTTETTKRAERTLHLLDIENLIGDPIADAETVTKTIRCYREEVGVGPDDLAVLGTNGRLAFAAGIAWPGALLRIGRGRDGADLALLGEAVPTDVAERFGRVVVGSGDGIFSETVRRLRLQGCEVLIVGRAGAIARRLQGLADVRTLGSRPRTAEPSDLEEAA